MSDSVDPTTTSGRSAGKRVVRNSLLMFSSNIFIALVGLPIAGIVARHLGSTQYGIYHYSFSFVDIFIVLATLGLRSITVRGIAQTQAPVDQYLGLMLALRSLVSSVVLILLLLVSYFLHRDSLVLLTVGIASARLLLSACSTLFRDVFQGFERMGVEALTLVLTRTVTAIGALGVVWLNGTVIGIVGIYAFGAFVEMFVPWMALRKERIRIRPRFNAGEAVAEVRKGLPFATNAYIAMFLSKINPVLLGMLTTHAIVGIYAAGVRLMTPLHMLPDAIATALFPTVARGFRDPSVKVQPLLQRIFFYLLLIGLPISVGGFLCGEAIIDLIFGAEFASSAVVFQILISVIFLEFVSLPGAYVLGAIHQQRRVVTITALSALLNVSLNLWWIPRFGAAGSAWSGFVVTIFAFIGYQVALFPHYRVWGDPIRYLRLLLANAAMASAIYPLRDASIFLSIPLGMLVYGLAIFLFRVMTVEQARDFARQALGKHTS